MSKLWIKTVELEWEERKIDNLGGSQLDLLLIKMGLVLLMALAFTDEKLNYGIGEGESLWENIDYQGDLLFSGDKR